MCKPLSNWLWLAVTMCSVFAAGGCPPESPVATDEGTVSRAWPSLDPDPGQLKVDIGLDRVAAPGEVFWLPAEVTGGTLPYTFSWTCCSVATGGDKPLICGGDSSMPCITVQDTCHLRVTVTDANGETTTGEVQVAVFD